MSVTKVTGMMQTSTKGGDISSASPTVIDTDGDYFDVTGTTNFAAFTVTAGRRFTVQFDGALTMTHHATNLDLPGGASITTAAGDVAEFFATGTNTVQCVNYTKADGTAVVLADNSITLAKMAGGTDGNIISYDASGDPVAIATGSDGQVLTSTGAGSPPAFEAVSAGGFTAGTATATTSGTLVTFGSIPTGTKIIFVSYEEVSLSTNNTLYLRIGDSGGLETSGYVGSVGRVQSSPDVASNTIGFPMSMSNNLFKFSGAAILTLLDADTFTWSCYHGGKSDTTMAPTGGGHKSLSAELTQVAVHIDGGALDSGKVNIMYSS